MSTQTPDQMLAEFNALERRLKSAGRASEVEFNALDRRIKAAGYKAAPKAIEVPKTILPEADEPENNDCETIVAALKEVEQNIISAIKEEEGKEPAPPPEPTKPKGWKFTHKYDRYNKLTETVAEAI